MSAGTVDTVNGSIRIGSDAVVESVESVNGAIKLGDSVSVERGIEAVNGSIELGQGSEVGGTIETVNGDIDVFCKNGTFNLDANDIVFHAANDINAESDNKTAHKSGKTYDIEGGGNVTIQGPKIDLNP